MSIFNKIEKTHVDSNTFDLTHDVKLSCNFGELVPVCIMDTIPGDSFRISGNALVRLAPMVAPVMHRANVFMHYFFVPNRILWDNWEDFITGGREGEDTSVHPFINYNAGVVNNGDLYDHLGLPTQEDVNSGGMPVSAFPMAAYQKIYNDYFRDQNFTEEINSTLTDGSNDLNTSLDILRNRAWKHDYFTSALPWTQRGPEALLPLGLTAPIVRSENSGTDTVQFFRLSDGSPANGFNDVMLDFNDGSLMQGADGTGTPTSPGYIGVEDSHHVDLSTATASSILDIRRAFKLQEWLEKNARGGSRYIEQMQVHFGVQSSDKRLQRAEYIGGYSSPIKFSEVLQTTQAVTAPSDTPLGTMGGHGISVGGSKSYNYYCEEHGYIIGILSALPDTAYQQGIEKHFLRDDKFDYAFPSFAHIGEQPIVNGEIYIDDTGNNGVWGYTPRYAEYKFKNNRVAGDFRTVLDFWHMGRKFSALPLLNKDFIEMQQQEVERIFAVQTGEAVLWIQVLNEVKASRKLPIFGTPKF